MLCGIDYFFNSSFPVAISSFFCTHCAVIIRSMLTFWQDKQKNNQNAKKKTDGDFLFQETAIRNQYPTVKMSYLSPSLV